MDNVNILEMKNGSIVRSDCVIAIRLREALLDLNLGPAVIVDYNFGNNGGILVNECKDTEEQTQLLNIYKLKIGI